ncbi:MAG: hypothetical protein K9M96_11100 [Deltaproteobacteria bacterium]|nr:hypothetical protein [Deltaproteobacteria bacterium]
MIAVIADDLTGAAEIGGVATRLGFSAELLKKRVSPREVGADVVVYDTDSRECSAQEAATKVRLFAESFSACPGLSLFKKVDSACRGHIGAEIDALMKTVGFERALIIPASPLYGRRVLDGKIYIDGKPSDQSEFRCDPTQPSLSANAALAMQQNTSFQVVVLQEREILLPGPTGLFLPNAGSERDLAFYSQLVHRDTLPVGSAAFFKHWLLKFRKCQEPDHLSVAKESTVIHDGPALIVSGSNHETSRTQILRFSALGGKVIGVPTNQDRRVDEVIAVGRAAMEKGDSLALYMDVGAIGTIDPLRAVVTFADTVCRFIQIANPAIILISGGQTSEVITEMLGLDRFKVHRELAQGLVAVKGGPFHSMLFKPGSYGREDLLDKFLKN